MKRILVIITIVLVNMSLSSCVHFQFFGIVGSGPIVTRNFDLSNFDQIESQTVIDVEVAQGDSFRVVAEGHENIMDYLELRVINHKLTVDLMHGSYNHFEMKIYVTMPVLNKLSVQSTGNAYLNEFTGLESLTIIDNSTGNIVCDGTFEIQNNLEIKSRSTGNIRLGVNCDEIEASVSSTGNITLNGSCNYQDVYLSCTGNYNAFDLSSKECNVETNGTGDARITVSDVLNATIRSVGSIYYKGNPSVHIQDYSIGNVIGSN